MQDNGIFKIFRICEASRASKFLKAAIYLQDEVFTKMCRFGKRKPFIWFVLKMYKKLSLKVS